MSTLVNYTIPVRLVNGKATVNFDIPLRLTRKGTETFYVAVRECVIPYVWHNVSEKYNNHKLGYYDENGRKREITIDNGNHDCDSLNFQMVKYFQTPVEQLPITFSEPPGIPNRIAVSLKPGYKLDFTDYNIRHLLGFDSRVYEE